MTIAQETLQAVILVDAGMIGVTDIMGVDRLYFEVMGKSAIKLEPCFRVIRKIWANISTQSTGYVGD